MILRSPAGKLYTVGGFYHSRDTWKARFAPAETGNWSWSATLSDSTTAKSYQGSFSVVSSSSPGFVRLSQANPYRWVFDDGTPFYPVGICDCIDTETQPLFLWSMDSIDAAVTTDTYFRAFSQAGVNLFRWSVGNCAFNLHKGIEAGGNVYGEQEGQWGDTLAATWRRYGLRIFMAIFGDPPFKYNPTPAQLEAVKRYVKYVVDRYGAYVDYWELMNEAMADPVWFDTVASYLKSIDPYRHPVSTSFERPADPNIDISSPHWYETEDARAGDLRVNYLFSGWKQPGKPVIVGEQGNYTVNWDPLSAFRMRVRLWATFFAEGALVFWHTGYRKDYAPAPPAVANIYLGPEERSYIRVLQDVTRGFETAARPDSSFGYSRPDYVRGYALRGSRDYTVYLHAWGNHGGRTSGVIVNVSPNLAGVARWHEPATGRLLAEQNVAAGPQPLNVPDFINDVALKITGGTAPPPIPPAPPPPAPSPSCAVTITPAGPLQVRRDAKATQVQVSTTSQCQWSATSVANWLSVPSPATFAGPGTLRIDVLDNNTESARTGSVDVNGRAVTVIQTASILYNNMFVEQLYLDLLGRPADSAGKTSWVDALASGRLKREQVAEAFFTSPEFAINGSYVVKLYLGVFLRGPDFGGWEFWMSQLRGGKTQLAILGSFISSPEFQLRYGSLTDSQFIRLVYQNVLGRTPASSEVNAWLGEIRKGRTRAEVMYGFILSPEFDQLSRARAQASLLYVAFLRRSPDTTGLAAWTSYLATRPLISAIQTFITSSEYINRF